LLFFLSGSDVFSSEGLSGLDGVSSSILMPSKSFELMFNSSIKLSFPKSFAACTLGAVSVSPIARIRAVDIVFFLHN